jgi:hypothetical protein
VKKTTAELVLQAASDYTQRQAEWVEAANWPASDHAYDAQQRLIASRRKRVDEAVTMFDYVLGQFVDERIRAAGSLSQEETP